MMCNQTIVRVHFLGNSVDGLFSLSSLGFPIFAIDIRIVEYTQSLERCICFMLSKLLNTVALLLSRNSNAL